MNRTNGNSKSSCIVVEGAARNEVVDGLTGESEDWSSTDDEGKCYQTLSAVRYDEALPHVLQAVKDLNTAHHSTLTQFDAVSVVNGIPKGLCAEVNASVVSTCGTKPRPSDGFSGQSDADISLVPGEAKRPSSSEEPPFQNSMREEQFAALDRTLNEPSSSGMSREFSRASVSMKCHPVQRKSPHQSHTSLKRSPYEYSFSVSSDQPPHKHGRFIEINVPITSSHQLPKPSNHESSDFASSKVIASVPWQPHEMKNGPSYNSFQSAYENTTQASDPDRKSYCSLAQTLVPIMQSAKEVYSYGRNDAAKTPKYWADIKHPPASSKWSDNFVSSSALDTGYLMPNYRPCLEIRNAAFTMTRKYLIRSTSSPARESRNDNNQSQQHSYYANRSGSTRNTPNHSEQLCEPHGDDDDDDDASADNNLGGPANLPKELQFLTRSHLPPPNCDSNGFSVNRIQNSLDLSDLAHHGYDVVVQGLPSHVSPNDVFCLVPGRLGMANQGKRHEVLVGEILRRVLNPESLNISLLGPILRKAKSKNGSRFLRERLQQIGIQLPQGRRKTAKCTLFTSLTESEAGQLANDFSKLCQFEFPSRALAKEVLLGQRTDTRSLLTPETINVAMQLLDSFTEMISSKDLPHMCSRSWNANNDSSDRTSAQLYNFETLSHGFGIKALLSSMTTFRSFLLHLGEDHCFDG